MILGTSLRENLPRSSGEGCFVLQMEADFAGERSVGLQIGVAISGELDVARAEHVDVIGVPKIHLDGTPRAEQLAIATLRHAPARSSLDSRTSLHAAVVSMTIQPTLARPR